VEGVHCKVEGLSSDFIQRLLRNQRECALFLHLIPEHSSQSIHVGPRYRECTGCTQSRGYQECTSLAWMTPLRLRRALTLPKLQNAIGKENADRYLASIPPFVQPVQDIVTTTGFEAIWGRPGLEWKERRLIVMA
jgi:hypothetical protein